MPEDTRAFFAKAAPLDGVPLAHTSVWQLTVHPRGSAEQLVDEKVCTKQRGWSAVPELDEKLAELGWRRSWGWVDGPKRSIVAWLREPANVPAEGGGRE